MDRNHLHAPAFPASDRPTRRISKPGWRRGLAEAEFQANIRHSDRIARSIATSGKVTARIDLLGLLPERDRLDPEAALNAIAYDTARDRLFVIGTLWPKLFEIRVEPSSGK